MSSKQVQIRRDTAVNLAASTPALAELGFDTTNKRPLIGDGATAGGIVIPTYNDIQKSGFVFASAGGTGDSLTLTLSPAIQAYVAGLSIDFLATADNTGAAQVNVNGKGLKNIYKMSNGVLTALEDGDIQNGGIYNIKYDGTQFQIKGLDESPGGTKGWELLAVASGGGSSYDFTSDIDANYAAYAFLLKNVTPASNGVALKMRTRRSGQPSFDTDSNYTSISASVQANNTQAISSVSGGTEMTVASSVTSTSSVPTAFGAHGLIMAYNLGNGGRALFVGDLMIERFYVSRVQFGGNHATGAAIDGVRFFFDTGNIAAGEIHLYGIKTSL